MQCSVSFFSCFRCRLFFRLAFTFLLDSFVSVCMLEAGTRPLIQWFRSTNSVAVVYPNCHLRVRNKDGVLTRLTTPLIHGSAYFVNVALLPAYEQQAISIARVANEDRRQGISVANKTVRWVTVGSWAFRGARNRIVTAHARHRNQPDEVTCYSAPS